MPVAMLKLIAFSPYERPLAGLLKERLEMEGIACLLRNEELFAAMGEIPFWELRPELWIIDEDVLPRARLLLQGWLYTPDQAPPWTCPECGETLEGQFGACWKCGRRRE
jgi:Putative prokaryotic signal transducing protein